ncbi:Rhodanese-like domain-containing protein [Tricladium varicosporioides]|nr:Rhodanese-like domain-containing protein [Hymenoscyphus varicosporioides]
MSTPRLACSLLLRASRYSIAKPSSQFTALPRASRNAAPVLATASQLRFYSQDAPPTPKASKIYTFEEIKSHLSTSSSSPQSSFILIDTREPSELATTGTIPGALNIPITTQPDAFFITAEEFEDRFGFERPPKEKEVVFYCKAGVRSRAAAALAIQAGWKEVGEYPGSWMEWEGRGGEKVGGRS